MAPYLIIIYLIIAGWAIITHLYMTYKRKQSQIRFEAQYEKLMRKMGRAPLQYIHQPSVFLSQLEADIYRIEILLRDEKNNDV